MATPRSGSLGRLSFAVRCALGRLDVLALFPLLTLCAIWLELGDIAVISAFLLPALLALSAIGDRANPAPLARETLAEISAAQAGLAGHDALLAMLGRVSHTPGQHSACIVVQIDGWDTQVNRWGAETAEHIAVRVAERLCSALRRDDLVARLGDARFGIVLHPVHATGLGTRQAVVDRLRASLGEPIAVGGASVCLTVCTGHASLQRQADNVAKATLRAAEAALTEAKRHGPDTARAYAEGLLETRRDRSALADEVENALARGQIRAWFQPQVCTDSGIISGFEALARWHHPQRGVLTPATFLDAIADAGRMPALGNTMLVQALTALQAWDKAGLRVPSVSVNFSADELRAPGLADRVKWEIDRFDLRPGRLTVEILETVAAEAADEAVMATIASLRAHGINLDLDDFGIGQASLAAVRRFGVNRIKIDRSFILAMDQDPEQQAMVAAVLSMADHLGVETLAEGVETAAVRCMLAQMGCDHLQGYHIFRPMPFENTVSWLTRHNATLAQLPTIGRRAV